MRGLTDPASALKTLHWGRNYLYTPRLETAAGPLEVVVKQFRHRGARDRLKRRLQGSKAEKSWRVARALLAAGLLTPNLPPGSASDTSITMTVTFVASGTANLCDVFGWVLQ